MQPVVLCPAARKVLDLIADRWSLLVIHILSLDPQPKRYGEIKRVIDGISQKMLTQTLRQLEENGLVTRTYYPVIPPHVEYALTPLGESLVKTLEPVIAWSETHLPHL